MKYLKNPYLWSLIVIIGVNLYLRLWHITSLFKWIYDYDEGAYSVGGLLISQGYGPYRDFTLVHPPFYDYLLAGIYEIFGYNFFYGRYLSVIISVVCIILAYFIIRKLFNSTAGLIAALLFVVFPGFFTLLYRVVQEPLGILLVLSGIFLLTDYLKDEKINYKLILSGIFLGLAVATKYTFVPAVLGIALSIFIINKFNKASWILAGSIIIGFFIVSGYFIITNPQGFIDQTVLSQFAYRSGGYFQTFINRVNWFHNASWPDKITTICIFLPYLVFLLYLIRKHWTRLNVFFTVSLFISLAFTVFYNPIELRYLAPSFTFMILILAGYVPEVSFKEQISYKVATAFLLLVVLFAGSLTMRQDYNYYEKDGTTYEENVYKLTIEYLDGEKAYSLNPIITALSPDSFPSGEFDTFGLLFTMNIPADEVMNTILKENPNYIITDAFSSLFSVTGKKAMQNFLKEIQEHTIFVTFMGTGEVGILETGIYQVK